MFECLKRGGCLLFVYISSLHRQIDGQKLFVQSLATELVELDFARKVGAHNVLDAFADRWFEGVLVDAIEVVLGICRSGYRC